MGTNNIECLNEQTKQLVGIRCVLQWTMFGVAAIIVLLVAVVILLLIKS